jgi:hypothetical protein
VVLLYQKLNKYTFCSFPIDNSFFYTSHCYIIQGFSQRGGSINVVEVFHMTEPKESVTSVDDLLDVPVRRAKPASNSGRFRRVLSAIRKPVVIIGIAAAGLVGGTVIGTTYSEGIREWAGGIQRSYAFWTAPDDEDIVGDFKEKDSLYNEYGEQGAADSLRDRICRVVSLDGNYECRRIR